MTFDFLCFYSSVLIKQIDVLYILSLFELHFVISHLIISGEMNEIYFYYAIFMEENILLISTQRKLNITTHTTIADSLFLLHPNLNSFLCQSQQILVLFSLTFDSQT